jgi:hypothetical protein
MCVALGYAKKNCQINLFGSNLLMLAIFAVNSVVYNLFLIKPRRFDHGSSSTKDERKCLPKFVKNLVVLLLHNYDVLL